MGASERTEGRTALTATPVHRTIDVHHHFDRSGFTTEGVPWAIERAVDELERNGIATAIGYAGPIYESDPQAARREARETNEWSTGLCHAYPGRFGLFASLPMNDVAASLDEIAYAFDVLGADGIGLATSYGDAWLGDDAFFPIFEELNRRHAVVYVHPMTAACCTKDTLTYLRGTISAPWIEFPTNTARTILNLWSTGTTRRLPDLKWIFSHGGGTMPSILGRIAGFTGWTTVGPQRLAGVVPDGVYAEFAKLYFECAQAYAPETIDLLRKLVPPTHLLFGSDYSYFPIAHAVEQFARLDLPPDVRQLMSGANAATLLPRWRPKGTP